MDFVYVIFQYYSLCLLPSPVAVPTFVSFLKEVESPYEVHDYIRAYLGDTSEAKEFAKQFLERRAKQKASQRQQQQQPAPPQPQPQQQQVCGGGGCGARCASARPLSSRRDEKADGQHLVCQVTEPFLSVIDSIF